MHSHFQYQQQIPRQQTVQDQEMQYIVQQDFLNFIGIANDVQEVINYFGPNSNHIMIEIYLNKLTLQTNLSNGIHVDQNSQAYQNGKTAELQNQKAFICQHLENLLQNKQFDPRIMAFIESYYKNSLTQNPVLRQLEGKELNLNANFDQKTVEKVLQSVISQDQQFERIRQGERIQILNQSQIDAHLKKRSAVAQQKLDLNWRNQRDGPIYQPKDTTCECSIF